MVIELTESEEEKLYANIIYEIGDNEKLARKYLGKPEYREDIKALEDDTSKLRKIQEKIEKENYNFTISELDLIVICLKDQIQKNRDDIESFERLKMPESKEIAQKNFDILCGILKKIQG